MENELDIEEWAKNIMRGFDAAERKKRYKQMAQALRKQNQKRITKQQGPDGSSWKKRKPISRRNNQIADKGKMMKQLRKVKNFRLASSDAEAWIGWTGNNGQIAYEHHHGEKVKQVQLPERPMLGTPKQDIDIVRALMLQWLEDAAS